MIPPFYRSAGNMSKLEALKLGAKWTVTWTVTCKVDRDLDRDYTTKLNLAGGLGGRGPERRGGELKKALFSLCFLPERGRLRGWESLPRCKH